MNAYIISYNRLTPLRNLCRDLVERGCTPVIVDNGSTYEPLKDWLYYCTFEVQFLANNAGHLSPWTHRIVKDENYIVTDSDMDISGVPLDMLDVLKRGLKETPTAIKSGLSLRIDDLPDNEYANTAKEYEQKYWITKAGDFYSAPIDTTLALYAASRMKNIVFDKDCRKHSGFYNGVRAPPPYSARHTPWYLTPETLTDEEKYYMQSIGTEGFWTRKFLEINKQIK